MNQRIMERPVDRPCESAAAVDYAAQLRGRIDSGSWTAAVYGLGYVGLPLAVAMAEHGVPTIGYDVSLDRVAGLSRGHSHVEDVTDDDLGKLMGAGLLSVTLDPAETRLADVVIIAVPTPSLPSGEPDLSYIRSAATQVAQTARPGQLISLESTTYPGTTREIIVRMLTQAGFTVGQDIFVVHSPERINPGDRTFNLTEVPKLVGGVDPTSAALGAAAYATFVAQVHTVRSSEVAELTKLLENVFRAVNIALANEMAMLCHELDVDIWDVVAAAGTKPFGFLPHYPGPGVGGHCIPVDPVYLLYSAKRAGSPHTRLLETAMRINSGMPYYVLSRLTGALRRSGRESLVDAKVLLLGVAYKAGTADIRESPAVRVAELLRDEGAIVSYHDPLVPEVRSLGLQSEPLDAARIADTDAVVLLTDQPGVDVGLVLESVPYLLDCRDGLRRRGLAGPQVEVL